MPKICDNNTTVSPPEEKKDRGSRLSLHMPRSVLMKIRNTIGSHSPETGGMLGGVRDKDQVTHFEYDHGATRTFVTYSPDYDRLNQLLKTKWNPSNIDLLGFVHSHPDGCRRPSGGDLNYARDILDFNKQIERLWLPIVTLDNPDKFEMLVYYAERARNENGVEIKAADLVIDEDVQELVATTFKRVKGVYDLERLAHCRLIIVGVGGAAQFVEEMSRAGIGEMVLIDPDIVSESNIATQQVYRRDIGRPKVDCVAERVMDINPTAKVVPMQNLLDEIDDKTFQSLIQEPLGDSGLKPVVTLLCGFTDNFSPQARVNRLALKYGIPSLCAQLHAEARSMEITFTYPGITPACNRCVLSTRYKAYLQEGFQNDVTSDRAPIFATGRLNALKGYVAMAILHHGISEDRPGYARWGKLLERIGNRNLELIRMDPDSPLPQFQKVFGGADQNQILFDETIWRPQEPENPNTGYQPCPDCGGTGNLLDSINKFPDTRKMVI